MPGPLHNNWRLVADETAFRAAGLAVALASRLPAPPRSLADQAIRAASSVPALFDEVRPMTWNLLQPQKLG
jgi:hypothetical protein